MHKLHYSQQGKTTGNVCLYDNLTKIYHDVTGEYLERTKINITGTVTIDHQIKLSSAHKNEIAMAYILVQNFGGNFEVKAEANENHIKSADYIWDGKLWDLKTFHSHKAPDSAVRKGLKQIRNNPGGLILNYEGDTPLNLSSTLHVVASRWKRHYVNGDVLFFDHGKFTQAVRFLKKGPPTNTGEGSLAK